MGEIKLLDCTLRDGGYINDWRFGEEEIPDMIEALEQTNVDILEIGFLKDEPYQEERTVFNSMEQVKKLIPDKKPGIEYAVMCEVVNPLPLEMLEPADEDSADIIRVIVWKTKYNDQGEEVDALREGYEYCKGIVEKGYKLCVQPARVSQYSDAEFTAMVKKFSTLNPMAIYVVDSWGTENAESLLHYMHLADDNMPREISLGYHGHNNMMQALGVAQAMLKEGFEREVIIDASVYGIGRGAGNLNLELIAKYLNEQFEKHYDTSSVNTVNEKYIQDIFAKEKWGYSSSFFLTAKYNCNPNYAKFIDELGAFDCAEELLAQLTDDEKVIFSKEAAERTLYRLRKELYGLAIVVPTSNRVEIIRHWINILGKEAYHYGCDLIFYDSSSDNQKQELTSFINRTERPNIKIVDYEGEVQGVLCPKIYAAAKMAISDSSYKYIWIVRDRSIPNLATIWTHIAHIINEQMDFSVIYPHYIEPRFYGHSVYTDCAKLFKEWCGEMTSLGSILFSKEILTQLVENYPIDGSNYGLWFPMSLFHCIAQKPFKAYFLSDASFTYLPYAGSFWIKNSTLLWLFAGRWNKMVDMLPAVYDEVRETVRRFEGWNIPPFGKELVLSARAAKDISIRRLFHYRNDLKRCAPLKIPKLICIALIPSNAIAYYLKKRSSRIWRMLSPIRKVLKFILKIVSNITQTIKSAFVPKQLENIPCDISNVDNNITKNQKYISHLLYGNPDAIVNPVISIIVPTNGKESYLRDALGSIMEQDPVNYSWECIIVDNQPYDGRKNGTQKIVEQCKSPQMLYYRNDSDLGADGNMNRGATLARGKWIAFLHDDDLLYPDFLRRIEILIRGLSSKKIEPGLVFGWQNFVYYKDFNHDSLGKIQFYWNSYYNTTRVDKYQLLRVVGDYAFMGENPFNIPSCGCTYLRKAYLEFGGHNEGRFGICDDAFLATLVLWKYGAYTSITPFGDYRWGSGTSVKNVRNIIVAHYKIRDYIYDQHIWSRAFKKSLQMEHTRFSEESFSHFNPAEAKEACEELVTYVPNPLRRFFVRTLRKMAHILQRHTLIDCEALASNKK